MAPVNNPELAKLELEAYTAVLRAFAAQQMNWAREKLLSEMRRELHISSDMHINITDKVMNDEELTAIRDGKPSTADRRSTGGAYAGEKRGRPARGRPPATADATPTSAPRRTDSRRRDTADFDAPKEAPERSFGAAGNNARNRSKRKAQPPVVEPPYAAARLETALANGTIAELDVMRDSLAKRASQLFAEILASVAPQAEYPDHEARLRLQLKELITREQGVRRKLEAVA